jgi:hypothetical protein
MARGHHRRRVELEVALLDQSLHELVEQLRELLLAFLVATATQRLEHLGTELPALHERVQDRALEGVERAIALVELHAVVRLPVAGEARLQKKVSELVEQRLQVDRVGKLRAVLAVGVAAHGAS